MENFLTDTIGFLMDNPEILIALWSVVLTIFLVYLINKDRGQA